MSNFIHYANRWGKNIVNLDTIERFYIHDPYEIRFIKISTITESAQVEKLSSRDRHDLREIATISWVFPDEKACNEMFEWILANYSKTKD